jgi:uncharacterized protein (DUF924 family)
MRLSEPAQLKSACCAGCRAAQVASFTHFAVKHKEVIAKCGRFPHRNAILGTRGGPCASLASRATGGSHPLSPAH